MIIMNEDRNEFYRLAEKAAKGLQQLAVPLGLTHVTPASYGPVLADAKTKRAAFSTSRHGKRMGYLALRAQRKTADTFIELARNYLMTFLGSSWSASWDQIGFSDGTLVAPFTDGDRTHVLECMKTYFTTNPNRELLLDEEDLTAARADELLTGLEGAMSNIDNCKLETRTKRDQRQSAEQLLETKLNCLYKELEAVLPSTDPRWVKFLDRVPGDPRVPEKVEGVNAVALPGGIISADWPDAARASHYKVLKQVVGVDAGLVPASTVEDSDVQLSDFPTGATGKLQIIPINSVGPGTPSEIIELQAA